jgi:hypothetical protein
MAHRTPLLTGDVITETVANDWLQRSGDHLTGPLEADGRDITGVGALAAAILTLKGDAHGAGHVLDGNAFDQTALPSAYPDGITAFSDSSGLWPGSSAAHVLTIESPLFECVMQLKGSRTDAVLVSGTTLRVGNRPRRRGASVVIVVGARPSSRRRSAWMASSPSGRSAA